MFLKSNSKKFFKEVDGIYQFTLDDNTAKKISNFYSSNPFPNYKENDDLINIVQKGNRNLLAKQFKKFVGFNKKILEVGSGTGQLSIYFSNANNNNIFAMDATLESLKIAKRFTKKNNIKNIKFINADIFDDVLKEEYFDFIWCNGVLHHTKDPYAAFNIIVKSLKKRGYILLGLYNKFGRARTLIRKIFYKIFGKGILNVMDPTLRKLKISNEEQTAWIKDQYEHPQESLHTFDEVISWFKKNNIDFVSSIPHCDLKDFNYENIFKEKKIGTYIERIINQINMIFNKLGSDGGLFIVIGRKKDV